MQEQSSLEGKLGGRTLKEYTQAVISGELAEEEAARRARKRKPPKPKTWEGEVSIDPSTLTKGDGEATGESGGPRIPPRKLPPIDMVSQGTRRMTHPHPMEGKRH